MKAFYLVAYFTHIVLAGLLQKRQITFDACDPRDKCVQNIGLPGRHSPEAITDCVIYLEHTSTVEGVTIFATASVPDGLYTTTTTVGWYVKQYGPFQSIGACSLHSDSTGEQPRKHIPDYAIPCHHFAGQYASACSCLGVHPNTVMEISQVSCSDYIYNNLIFSGFFRSRPALPYL
jgi:hypothetical protein